MCSGSECGVSFGRWWRHYDSLVLLVVYNAKVTKLDPSYTSSGPNEKKKKNNRDINPVHPKGDLCLGYTGYHINNSHVDAAEFQF